MRFLMTILAAAFLTACSAESPKAAEPAAHASEDAHNAEETAKVAAVLMYADWCGSCKTLDPKLKAVKAQGGFDGVNYVVLDYTAKDADAVFAAADEAGVGAAVRTRFAEKLKTGLLLLVDVENQTVLKEINKTMTEDDIKAAVQAAAA